MKKLTLISAALLFSAGSLAAFADTPPVDAKAHADKPVMHDCGKIADADKKAKCETHQAARKAAMEKCKDKAHGKEHRECMKENMQRPTAEK